jgi:uncharacterized membrane protein YoaK (UPF0700 family)
VTVEAGQTGAVRVRNWMVVVLAVVSGGTDALGYLALGGVFASVMTGNMVLLGINVSEHGARGAVHTGIALICYVVGCAVGARIAGSRQPRDGVWPVAVTCALAAEFALSVAVTIGWWATHGHPHGTQQTTLLALAAIGLGIQSSAVGRFGVSGLSSTYLTGTLTTAVSNLVHRRRGNVRHNGLVLLGLIGGAALGTLLARYATMAAPLLMVVALGTVVTVAATTLHGAGADGRSSGRPRSGRDRTIAVFTRVYGNAKVDKWAHRARNQGRS